MRGTIIIFVKAPRAGAVKTRLGKTIGMGRAAALFRVLTERTIREAEKTGYRVVLAVDPPSALRGWGSIWPPHLERVEQGPGNLGDRMGRVMAQAPAGPCCRYRRRCATDAGASHQKCFSQAGRC